jgi:hypothetical protein
LIAVLISSGNVSRKGSAALLLGSKLLALPFSSHTAKERKMQLSCVIEKLQIIRSSPTKEADKRGSPQNGIERLQEPVTKF